MSRLTSTPTSARGSAPISASEGLNSKPLEFRKRGPALRAGIAIAAMLLLAVPLMTVVADARGGGGHGGGGHGGGGHGGGFGRGGGHIGGIGRGGGLSVARHGGHGVAGRSFSGPRLAGAGPRSVAGNRFAGRTGVASARIAGGGNRFTTAAAHGVGPVAAHGGVGRLAGGPVAGRAMAQGAFGNRAIANPALRTNFASARFHGRFWGSPWFAGSRWPWWRTGIVIGWVGPVFWPYAYYDVFDYVYWPYAYDDFWPYAYDDVYYGIYGSYAYGGSGVGNGVPRAGTGTRRVARSGGGSERRAAEVCSDRAADLTDWPIERISEIVQPTDAQRPALEDFRAASARSIDILKAGCPKDLPSTPVGRLAAMDGRLQVMLQAVETVRPALDRFYQSLSNEQKARFNAIAPGSDASTGDDPRDLTKFCDERSPGVTDLPIDRIAQAVQPTPAQRSALDELKDASARAADGLKANCPTTQSLTPTGRVEAMEKRLQATLAAVRTVQPALTKFYDSLSDEQKARFNSLRSASRPVG
jgi:LTXXQ motif family protein